MAALSGDDDPDLSAALDQVLHVPLDQVKMLLDVVEVLDGLIRPHAARRALLVLLRRADLLQGLVEGVPEVTEQIVSLQQRAEAAVAGPQRTYFTAIICGFIFTKTNNYRATPNKIFCHKFTCAGWKEKKKSYWAT